MKYILLIFLFSGFHTFLISQSALDIVSRTISRIEKCKTISHHSKQKWGNIGDINDYNLLEGKCLFSIVLTDTMIKAYYKLNANGISDLYNGNRMTRIDSNDSSVSVTDLTKYRKDRNAITSFMLYNESVIDIYNMFLEAKANAVKTERLSDTVINNQLCNRVSLIYADAIDSNHQQIVYKKIISIDPKNSLPVHCLSISISEYGQQNIESMLSDYKFNFSVENDFFLGGTIPHKYKIKQLLPGPKQVEKTLMLNEPAPDFDLPTVKGGIANISSLRGKVTLLEFSGIHCGFCLASVKDLNRLYETVDSTKVAILSVYSDEASDRINQYSQRYKMKYQVLCNRENGAPGQLLLNKYQVEGIPHFILIDRQGIIRYNSVGYSVDLYEILAKEIRALL